MPAAQCTEERVIGNSTTFLNFNLKFNIAHNIALSLTRAPFRMHACVD